MNPPISSHRLLIHESPLQVLPSLAVAIGLNEAIILQQVQYWLTTSTHMYEGRRWVYNTIESWHKQFPFIGERTLRRTIDQLRDSGLLLTANFNQHKFDRTLWYSIDYNVLEEASGKVNTPSGQNVQMDMSDSANGVPDMHSPSGQPDQMRPDSATAPSGQPVRMLIEQRLHAETTQQTTPPPRARGDVGFGGGGGDERMETDDEGNSPEDSQWEEADTANVKADLVDALAALGVRPEMAKRAVDAKTVTSDRDVILCKRFIQSSTAASPQAVLWSQYLSAGRLPPAPYSDTSTVSEAQIAAARRLADEADARSPEPDQYVGSRAMAAALAGSPLKHIARAPLAFPGRTAS